LFQNRFNLHNISFLEAEQKTTLLGFGPAIRYYSATKLQTQGFSGVAAAIGANYWAYETPIELFKNKAT